MLSRKRILKIAFTDTMPAATHIGGDRFLISIKGPLQSSEPCVTETLVTYYILPSGRYAHFIGSELLVCDKLSIDEIFIRDIVCFCDNVTIGTVIPSDLLAMIETKDLDASFRDEIKSLLEDYILDYDDIIDACQGYQRQLVDMGIDALIQSTRRDLDPASPHED